MRNPFHQATVAEENPGPVIDDLVVGTVELRCQHLFCERHTDGVGYALPQRPGRGFDRQVPFALGVAGGPVSELPEISDLVDLQRIAAQVQKAVKQHRAVTVRQHESVAVPPLGIARVMLQVIVP